MLWLWRRCYDYGGDGRRDDIGRTEMTDTSAPAQTLTGGISLELPEFDAPPEDPLGLLTSWLELVDASANLAGYREGWSGGRRNDVSCRGPASM